MQGQAYSKLRAFDFFVDPARLDGSRRGFAEDPFGNRVELTKLVGEASNPAKRNLGVAPQDNAVSQETRRDLDSRRQGRARATQEASGREAFRPSLLLAAGELTRTPRVRSHAGQRTNQRRSFTRSLRGDTRNHSTFLCAATAAALHSERMSRSNQVSASSGIR